MRLLNTHIWGWCTSVKPYTSWQLLSSLTLPWNLRKKDKLCLQHTLIYLWLSTHIPYRSVNIHCLLITSLSWSNFQRLSWWSDEFQASTLTGINSVSLFSFKSKKPQNTPFCSYLFLCYTFYSSCFILQIIFRLLYVIFVTGSSVIITIKALFEVTTV